MTRFFALALSGSITLRDGKAVNTIDALPLPMKPRAAAAWSAAGLPLVMASDRDELAALCREASERYAGRLRESWDAMGVAVEVVVGRKGELFEGATS